MFYSNEFYNVLFTEFSKKENKGAINILFYFKVIDELYSHNQTCIFNNGTLADEIFKFCELRLLYILNKKKIINNSLILNLQDFTTSRASNYPILCEIFRSFDRLFVDYTHIDEEFMESANEELKETMNIYFLNYSQNKKFIGDIFYN